MEKLRLVLVGLSILFCIIATGQDIYFSQFDANPLNLNPALTGDFDGKYRAITQYRNQSLPILLGDSYQTITGSFDGRTEFKSGSYLGYGLTAYLDRAGELRHGTTQLNLSSSFAQLLSKSGSKTNYLIGGAQIGIARRSVDLTNARWPSQHDGNGGFDPTAPAPNLPGFNPDFLHLDINVGLAWKSKFGERKSLQFGFAAYHINKPNISFYGNGSDVALSTRATFHASGELPISEMLSLAPSLMFLKQGVHSQLNIGTDLRVMLPENNSLSSVKGGLFYRIGNQFGSGVHPDALIMVLSVQLRNLMLGFSYDYTISKLKEATSSNGSIEISIGYLIAN